MRQYAEMTQPALPGNKAHEGTEPSTLTSTAERCSRTAAVLCRLKSQHHAWVADHPLLPIHSLPPPEKTHHGMCRTASSSQGGGVCNPSTHTKTPAAHVPKRSTRTAPHSTAEQPCVPGELINSQPPSKSVRHHCLPDLTIKHLSSATPQHKLSNQFSASKHQHHCHSGADTTPAQAMPTKRYV